MPERTVALAMCVRCGIGPLAMTIRHGGTSFALFDAAMSCEGAVVENAVSTRAMSAIARHALPLIEHYRQIELRGRIAACSCPFVPAERI